MPVPGILTVWRIPRLLTFSLNPRGPTLQDDVACMCSRISISISRWPWRRRESRTHAPRGRQRWSQRSRGGLAPLASRRTRRTTTCVLSAARSGAARHLVVGVDVRSSERTPRVLRRRRFVPPERRGQKPQSGQERPPRRRRYAAPALTPRGGRSCPSCYYGYGSSRQTDRRTARGGLSTARRPIVVFSFVAWSRCLLTDRPLNRCRKLHEAQFCLDARHESQPRVQPTDDVASMAANKPPGSLADRAPHHVPIRKNNREAASRARLIGKSPDGCSIKSCRPCSGWVAKPSE